MTQDQYKMTELYWALVMAAVVILITFLLSRRLKKPMNVIVLTGISNSGKTALFSKIIFNKPKKSVTSLKENEAIIEEMNIKLVDLPGADRLRDRFWERYRNKAKHIIVVIDATTVDSKLRDVSEHLYSILSDATIHKNKIRLSIACNKQDIEGALSRESIRSMLEKELCAIRHTKSGQLSKTSNEANEDYIAMFKSRDLTLENLSVDVVETCIFNVEQLIKIIF